MRPSLTEPDPSLGDDGQYAFQPTTGKTWAKVDGVWTYLGIYKGFNFTGAYNGATTYSLGDVMTDAGSSYVYINATPGSGHTPPNVTYWQLLASIGNTGPTGPTGAGYGGTSTTSLAIGTGSKAFTTQAGLAYTSGARVRATATGGATGWLEGVATYSGTTLTITSDKISGSGTGTAWNLNVVGEPGAGSGVNSVNVVLFTSSGTYAPSANLLYAEVEARGSGAGGGGRLNNVPGGCGGGGGGQGSLSKSTLSAATIGASQTVTIGNAGKGGAAGLNAGSAGSTCSFGTLVIGNGGGGGGGSDPAVQNGVSGAPGSAGTGQFCEAGIGGGPGNTISGSAVTNIISGTGGGAGGGTGTASGNGATATGYGAGGAGGARTASGTTGTSAGDDGSKGYVLIKEYLS